MSAAPATRESLDELRAAMAAEVDERVDRGMCGCGCPSALPVPRARRRYVNERHRQRAYRDRLEREANLLGVPARLSRGSLQMTVPTGDRHADAQSAGTQPQRRRSSPRPGVTVYVPTTAAAARLLDVLAVLEGDSVIDAHREALRAAIERRLARPG